MTLTVRMSLIPILMTLVAACVAGAPDEAAETAEVVEVAEAEPEIASRAQAPLAANDFSIAPNPTSRTVEIASSTTYQIVTAVISGSAQSIHLTVSGLPSGVSGSFSPATITAGQSSTLTLSTALFQPPGTPSQFTITGTGTSATHSATASVTVVPRNAPPNVAITAPASGATVSGLVTVSATASDSDGSVVSVKFILPNESFTDTTPPYSITWNSTAVANASSYQITVIATDNKGSSAAAFRTTAVQN
jgi:hypothetical protein